MTYYMHTMNGNPASFDQHHRTLYFVGGYGPGGNAVLCRSLRELRRQQEEARETDRRDGVDVYGTLRLGYVRVILPNE